MGGINFHQGYKMVTRILKTGSKINFFLHVYACYKNYRLSLMAGNA